MKFAQSVKAVSCDNKPLATWLIDLVFPRGFHVELHDRDNVVPLLKVYIPD